MTRVGPWIPPPAVAAAAKRGQQLRAKQPKSNQCCMATGIARAKQLSSRSPVSYKDLVTMRAWFARHAVDARGKGWGKDSKGFQAFLMWGGQPGKEWCERILKEIEMKKRKNPTAKKNPAHPWHMADVVAGSLSTGETAIIGRADSFEGVSDLAYKAGLSTNDQPTWMGDHWFQRVR